MVSSPPVQGNPARAAFPLPQGPRSGPGRQGRDGKGSGSGHLFGQAQAAQDEAPHLAHFRAQGRVIKAAEVGADGKEIAPAVSLDYGQFLQATFDFLIIAFAIFLFIRLITKLTTKKAAEEAPAAPPAPPAPTKEEVLLTEIRDLLKEKK